MTNYERIKNMSVDELALLFTVETSILMDCTRYRNCEKYKTCTDCYIDWLNEEVEE